jgi:16S rRNA (cytosine967-C5)-methyltransferase
MHNPREIAFEILVSVLYKNQFSNKLLNAYKKQNAISDSDMAFITKLVYGSIQYKVYFEYVTNKIIDEIKTKDELKAILYLACYEFLDMNSPSYAVVNEYVELSKSIDANASGFVNKVLKTLFDSPKLFDIKIKNKKNIVPLREGIPFFIYQKFEKDFGTDVALKIIKNINVPKSKSFRINTLKTSEKSFYENLNMDHDFKPSKIAKNCFTTELNLIGSKIFEAGLIYAQDQCSVLAAQIADPKMNSRVLDLCCAPGGKLTHLAAIMKNTGTLIGNEINLEKNKLILENLNRLGVTNCEVTNYDGSEFKSNELFDLILLDAPCSGLGVMRNKPEVRLKSPNELFGEELLDIQKKLLINADRLLVEGGVLVYSTCTINKDENANQIRDFISENKNYEIIEEHQFFGFEYNTDGFYICKLKKNN